MQTSRMHSTISDAESGKRINYPGSGNNSQFRYDSKQYCVMIVEVSNGTPTSTSQYLWDRNERLELRNDADAVVSRFFSFGQSLAGSPYLYTSGHIRSTREVTNNAGESEVQCSYDQTETSNLNKHSGILVITPPSTATDVSMS